MTKRPQARWLIALIPLIAACTLGATPAVSPTSGAAAPLDSAAASPESTTAAATSQPSGWPKLDGQIVFEDVGDNFVHTQIWILNSSASNARQLVTDDFTDGPATLSPNGRTVAFTRIVTFSFEDALADPTLADRIMLVNVDGSGLREIKTGFGGRNLCADDMEGDGFSPDGGRIVFARLCVNSATFGLWTANVDGTDAREVTRNAVSHASLMRYLRDGIGFAHVEDHRASWSPNAKRLVFQRVDTSTSPERVALFTIGIDGKDLRQVTPWELDANDPDWSPDGALLVFNSPAESPILQNIYTIRPDGTALTQLTSGLSTYADGGGPTFHPTWSPDGRQILFTHSPSTGGVGDLFVMNADGSDLHLVAPTTINENDASWGPSPAP